jgi:FkbM family methyltransferase
MNFVRSVAMQIPTIRHLYDSREALLVEREALLVEREALLVEREALLVEREALLVERDAFLAHIARLEQQADRPPDQSRFYYNSSFDPIEVMRRHAVPNLRPRDGYLTNFLGVVINPTFYPSILDGRDGQVEPIPIPANWHADIAEWGAALRAVDLSRNSYTVVELGCGWGCWMINTGVAARRAGLEVHLIGVEADKGHIDFAREACQANGFLASEFTLKRGIAAARGGTALFPRQERAGLAWGLEPIFNANEEQREIAVNSENYEELPMISLTEVVGSRPRVDLLHIDIQGGEADLIAGSRSVLSEKIAYILIGTHSRQIEGLLFNLLLEDGWQLEIERPAVLSNSTSVQTVTVDGVQGWRNPRLLPDQR